MRKNSNVFFSPPISLCFFETSQKKNAIYGIEVFKVGDYRNISFTHNDISTIAENFHLLKEKVGLEVPLKVNHTDDANAIIGWVMNVYEKEGKLYADAVITEPEAFEKIKRGTWKKVSCEIYMDFVDEETNTSYGKALRAIAIVAHPQVKKVKGLEVARFFAEKISNGKEVIVMALKEAMSSVFGWLSERFKKLAEETEKLEVEKFGAVRHSLDYDKSEESWDADAAEIRLRKWASSDGSGAKETIDWAKYREGFAWYDENDAENFGAYKLPHHDIVNGRFSVVWRGVVAAMAALKGARGGVDIPAGDREAVYNHLRRHYEEFEREAPELSEPIYKEGDDEKVKELQEKVKTLEEELAKRDERIAELEKELQKKLAEEKEKRIWAIVNAYIEKGKLLPAEKDAWAEYLLSLSDEELEKAIKLIEVRPAHDLFEEKSKTMSPEEAEEKVNEELAERMASYVTPKKPAVLEENKK
jgi:flagellar motility protein MotE (MotC chaperone)